MKTVPVTNLKDVNVTQYVDGDVFITEKQIAVLYNGKIEPLIMESDLKLYVKKTEVVKMIDAALKKVTDK